MEHQVYGGGVEGVAPVGRRGESQARRARGRTAAAGERRAVQQGYRGLCMAPAGRGTIFRVDRASRTQAEVVGSG